MQERNGRQTFCLDVRSSSFVLLFGIGPKNIAFGPRTRLVVLGDVSEPKTMLIEILQGFFRLLHSENHLKF